MPIVKTHPLEEILSRKLFGFTTVPPQEQKRMVNRAIKAAMKEYDILEAQNAKIDREHAERVAELEKDIDKMMPAYEAIEHVVSQRDELYRMNDDLHRSRGSYMTATKGHTLENTAKIMGSLPPAEELERHKITNVAVYFDSTPIIEYIPTEEIVDALIDELGRIECEVYNNSSSNKGWIPSILIQVESDVEYAYETPKAGKHDMRWWNQCRIKRSTIESLRGAKMNSDDIRTPIIEYLTNEEITDELAKRRPPAQFRESDSQSWTTLSRMLVHVRTDLDPNGRYIDDWGNKWRQCRVKND